MRQHKTGMPRSRRCTPVVQAFLACWGIGESTATLAWSPDCSKPQRSSRAFAPRCCTAAPRKHRHAASHSAPCGLEQRCTSPSSRLPPCERRSHQRPSSRGVNAKWGQPPASLRADRRDHRGWRASRAPSRPREHTLERGTVHLHHQCRSFDPVAPSVSSTAARPHPALTLAHWKRQEGMATMPAASGTEARRGPKHRPRKMPAAPHRLTKAAPVGSSAGWRNSGQRGATVSPRCWPIQEDSQSPRAAPRAPTTGDAPGLVLAHEFNDGTRSGGHSHGVQPSGARGESGSRAAASRRA